MSETTHRQRENAFGLRAAKLLLEIKAVNFRLDDPFILTSGWASPVYIDCRKLISYPKERQKMMDLAVQLLDDKIDFNKVDCIIIC